MQPPKRLRKPFQKQQQILKICSLFLLLALGCFAALKYIPGTMGHVEEFIARTINAELKHVMVEGAAYVSKPDLARALNVQKGDSLVGFDAGYARKRLVALPWIREAVVERQLPATLRVTLYEQQPVARVAAADGVWVINQNGDRIVTAADDFKYLPRLSGDGVETQVAGLLTMMSLIEPTLLPRVFEAKWIGARRFDLGFATGAWVQLPEKNPAEAIRILSQLHLKKRILDRKGVIVDLRLADRIVIRMPADSKRAERLL